jgi:hypothetical protein
MALLNDGFLATLRSFLLKTRIFLTTFLAHLLAERIFLTYFLLNLRGIRLIIFLALRKSFLALLASLLDLVLKDFLSARLALR